MDISNEIENMATDQEIKIAEDTFKHQITFQKRIAEYLENVEALSDEDLENLKIILEKKFAMKDK